MPKLIPLLPLLLFCLFACREKAGKTPEKPPNLILIMADDLGMETLGCYGGESYQTPQLDKLAAGGMQFHHCYSTPLCTPSRVQLMTGKYNNRNYIGFGLLDPQETTFADLLKSAGYRTCIAGKWQLLGNERQRELAGGKIGTLPADAGFDDWCLWQMEKLGSRYKSPTLSIKGKETQAEEGKYGPDLYTAYLENFMEQAHQDGVPFFAYYPMALTHDPFQPTPDQDLFVDYDPQIHPANDTAWFGDMVTYMDKMVGRIVQKTEALGIRENTLILFIGDNGTDQDVVSTWKGKKVAGKKGLTLEAGTHVPFIASWPGHIAPQQMNDNLIDFTDFLPSLLEAAQTKVPADFVSDGLSFFPQLLGKSTKTRDWIFCDYNPNWGNFTPRRYAQDREWKLYADGAFYHFSSDPDEQNPLDVNSLKGAKKTAYAKLKTALTAMEKS